MLVIKLIESRFAWETGLWACLLGIILISLIKWEDPCSVGSAIIPCLRSWTVSGGRELNASLHLSLLPHCGCHCGQWPQALATWTRPPWWTVLLNSELKYSFFLKFFFFFLAGSFIKTIGKEAETTSKGAVPPPVSIGMDINWKTNFSPLKKQAEEGSIMFFWGVDPLVPLIVLVEYLFWHHVFGFSTIPQLTPSWVSNNSMIFWH